MSPVTKPTGYSPIFLRCRTIAFSAITFFSFIWIILLCVVLFIQWDFMNTSYRSVILVMMLVDSITAVLLLVLLTRKFRAWLDAARIAFILAAHLGVAGAFASYSAGFSCPQPTPEDQSMCRLLILYILISSWVLPGLVLIYAVGLGVMSYYRWRQSRLEEEAGSDIEKDGDSIERKRNLHTSQHSSFILPPPSHRSSIQTPIASQFATTLSSPNQPRLSTVPPRTPMSVDFSQFYLPSPSRASPATTPTATNFSYAPNPYYNYAMPSLPPLPPHWNAPPQVSAPPMTRPRKYSYPTVLTESIPEETSSMSGDSDRSYNEKRTSARLSKPSRSSRMPSL